MNKLFFRLSLALALFLFSFLPLANAQPSAPSSATGWTFFVTITGGGYGYGKSGSFLMTLGSDPAEVRFVGLSNVADNTAPYTYSASGAEGKVTIHDVVITFTFTDAGSGNYSLERGGSALNGYQKGRFIAFSGTAPDSLAESLIDYNGHRGDSPSMLVNYRLVMHTAHSYSRLDGNTMSAVNSYLVERLCDSTLRIYFNDAVRGQGVDHLVFNTATTGMFVYKIGSGKAYEVGTFSLEGSSPPTITRNPASVSVIPGTNVTFSVEATGTQPLSYQWFTTGGVVIPGATQSSFTIPSVSFDDAGRYRVQVSNFRGSVLSTAAVLTPVCQTVLDQRFAWIGPEGGEVRVNVTNVGDECDWGVQITNAWVTSEFTDGLTFGEAEVVFLIATTTNSASRVANVRIGTQNFKIFQAGAYAPARISGLTIRLHDLSDSVSPFYYYTATTANLLNETSESGTTTNLAYRYERVDSSTARITLTNSQDRLDLNFTNQTRGLFTFTENAGGTFTGSFVLSQSRADQDADGRSDIIWQHRDGRIRVSYMDGTNTPTTVTAGTAKHSWITAITDFNRDGELNTLRLTNQTLVVDQRVNFKTGSLSLPFSLRGGAKLSDAWHTVAAQDMNQNGHTDILFQNTNGMVAYWRMSGPNFQSSFSPRNGSSAGLGWVAVSAADLNGDRDPDIIFWNRNTGQLAVWYMCGGDMVHADFIADQQSLGPNWRLRGVGDMNYDGHNDLIWQNTKGSGEVRIWFLEGVDKIGEWSLTEPAMDANWIVIAPK